jgi:hypothetical protein
VSLIVEVIAIVTVAEMIVSFSERPACDCQEPAKFARRETAKSFGDVARGGSARLTNLIADDAYQAKTQ